jgi:hypothetical protein
MTDPWAAAAVATAPAAGQQTAGQAPQGSTSLAGSLASKGSQLFNNGGNGNFYPALFNKTHAPGTKFTGTILTAPRDVQSMSFPRNEGDPRLPQYWVTDTLGKRKPGTDPVDARTGKPNDPVMDLLIELQTDIRFDAATLAAIGRPSDFEDDGKRAFQVSGSKRPKNHVAGTPTNSMRAVLDALEAAGREGLKITDEESMIGLKLDVIRVDRIQPGVSTSPWLYVARLYK